MIATVLDFSAEERARARLDPAAPAPAAAAGSLSQAFVRFLEAESTPRRAAALPAEMMAREATRRTEARAHRAAQVRPAQIHGTVNINSLAGLMTAPQLGKAI